MHVRRFASQLAAITLLVLFAVTQTVQGQTFTILHSFQGGSDGASPAAGLVRDPAGNFYGTTQFGGTFNQGTAYRLKADGTMTILHSFSGSPGDGAQPCADLIRGSDGALYGTTVSGGAFNLGTAFRLDGKSETILHSFSGGADGAQPLGSLVENGTGVFYGTTYVGGSFNLGTVFRVDSLGSENIIHSFAGTPTDGANPQAGLIRDTAGHLYGTMAFGGPIGYAGGVFEMTIDGNESAYFLRTQKDETDDYDPLGRLFWDHRGGYWGTGSKGGNFGRGGVFVFHVHGGFRDWCDFEAGNGNYAAAGVILDPDGNLYGTTETGGGVGKGVVFKCDTTPEIVVLHAFVGGAGDGDSPVAGLVRDKNGNLYGTTYYGGAKDLGVVFKVTP